MMGREWTKQEADEVYHMSKWGEGYFDIDNQGLFNDQSIENRW